MTRIQRVKKVCKWLIFNEIAVNETELAKILGYAKSSFSQILNEKVPLSEKFIDKLISLDKNIDKTWVLDGSNKMLLEDYNTDKVNNNNIENLKRLSEIETLNEDEQKRIFALFDMMIKEAKERNYE